ncbi:MAG: glucose 1-dehydrogenase [Proteobacteria bacterium]|nr:glucose 1-dehydrogenase [Pseudomonadota bacterium]
MGRLQGKVAVITGAASGIGRGTVDLFVREGAKVVAADVQDDKGARLEEEHGGALRYIHCDVTDETQIKAALDLAKSAFGRLDALFNNAGAAMMGENAQNLTAENFDSVMHLHVRAAMFGIKHATPIMQAQGGGSIISTASIAGLQNGYGPYLYSVAKAAIIHMTKLAAAEIGPMNIRVNCICPGFIATPIFARAIGMATQVADQTVAGIAEVAQHAQPIPKAGLPEDIAEAALFLASDGSKFVNGIALTVDGGITVGRTGAQQASLFEPLMKAMGLDPAMLQQQ